MLIIGMSLQEMGEGFFRAGWGGGSGACSLFCSGPCNFLHTALIESPMSSFESQSHDLSIEHTSGRLQ